MRFLARNRLLTILQSGRVGDGCLQEEAVEPGYGYAQDDIHVYLSKKEVTHRRQGSDIAKNRGGRERRFEERLGRYEVYRPRLVDLDRHDEHRPRPMNRNLEDPSLVAWHNLPSML